MHKWRSRSLNHLQVAQPILPVALNLLHKDSQSVSAQPNAQSLAVALNDPLWGTRAPCIGLHSIVLYTHTTMTSLEALSQLRRLGTSPAQHPHRRELHPYQCCALDFTPSRRLVPTLARTEAVRRRCQSSSCACIIVLSCACIIVLSQY